MLFAEVLSLKINVRGRGSGCGVMDVQEFCWNFELGYHQVILMYFLLRQPDLQLQHAVEPEVQMKRLHSFLNRF